MKFAAIYKGSCSGQDFFHSYSLEDVSRYFGLYPTGCSYRILDCPRDTANALDTGFLWGPGDVCQLMQLLPLKLFMALKTRQIM